MKVSQRFGLLFGVLWCCARAAAVDAATPADLVEALDAALLRQPEAMNASDSLYPLSSGDAQDTRWLAAPPTLSAIYAASDRSWGTDETEVAVSLPLQSPEHRRRNERLRAIDPELAEAGQALRRWQFSGWLRDLYARHQRAVLARDLAEREVAALEDFATQASAQADAGSLPPYDLWVIRQELRAARARLAQQQAAVAGLDRSYASFTGLAAWPAAAGEPSMLPMNPHYAEHPQARFMEANQTQALAALRAGSASLTPWSVGLIGREFSMANSVERQYGVTLNIPIGGVDANESVSVRSSERAMRHQYLLQVDSWRADLRQRFSDLRAEREALLAERALLLADDAVRDLGRQLETLQLSAEIPIENKVQRRLTLLRARSRPDVLAVEIAAAEAQLRQLAGDSL
ncbi:MAG: hypothetical protein V2I82_00665 [Halieaceae bacterium]|nr:hypothetical protein [Halieaceae bacterium]